MIGLLRALVPSWDRRSPSRFRDFRVQESLVESERMLKANVTLQGELRAIWNALPKKDKRQDGKSAPTG